MMERTKRVKERQLMLYWLVIRGMALPSFSVPFITIHQLRIFLLQHTSESCQHNLHQYNQSFGNLLNNQRRLGKAGSVRFPPLFVYGDDDCAIVYELMMNTHGLSVELEETKASKSGSESVALDVPLLFC